MCCILSTLLLLLFIITFYYFYFIIFILLFYYYYYFIIIIITYVYQGRLFPVWELVGRSLSSSLPSHALVVSWVPPRPSAWSVAVTTSTPSSLSSVIDVVSLRLWNVFYDIMTDHAGHTIDAVTSHRSTCIQLCSSLLQLRHRVCTWWPKRLLNLTISMSSLTG